jgi:hypothetical protein
MIRFEDIETFANELGGKPVTDLREGAEHPALPLMLRRLTDMPPAIAEAVLAHLMFFLVERDHVDPERIMKLLKLATAGSAVVFAEGGFFDASAKA